MYPFKKIGLKFIVYHSWLLLYQWPIIVALDQTMLNEVIYRASTIDSNLISQTIEVECNWSSMGALLLCNFVRRSWVKLQGIVGRTNYANVALTFWKEVWFSQGATSLWICVRLNSTKLISVKISKYCVTETVLLSFAVLGLFSFYNAIVKIRDINKRGAFYFWL